MDYLQSVSVLVVKGSWSFGAVLEQSSHLLLDGEGTAMFRDFVLPRILENFVDILEWI